MKRQFPAKPGTPQGLADGGFIAGLFNNRPKESLTERYRRQDAERAARQPQSAPVQAPVPQAQAAVVNPLDQRSVLERRERAAGLANGGQVPPAELIEGPGTGTSDSIPAELPVESFVAPADTAQVLLSNGEINFPPELLQAIGAAALEVIRSATHVPAEEQEAAAMPPEVEAEEQPVQEFADGGLVDDDQKRAALISQIPASGLAQPSQPPSPTIDASAGPLSRAASQAVAMQPIQPIQPSTARGGRGFDARARTAGGADPAYVPGTPSQQLAEASMPADSSTLSTSQARNVGFGIQSIPGGSSPLFTDGKDTAGDEKMMARGSAMSAQNQGALDRLVGRQEAESQARVQLGMRNLQQQREVADAQRTNQWAQERFSPPGRRELAARQMRVGEENAAANRDLAHQRFGFDKSRFGAEQEMAQKRFGFDVARAREQEAGLNARAMLSDQGSTIRAGIAASGKSNAPPGYRWNADRTGMEVIPGGPAALKAGQAAIGKALPAGAASGLLENHRNLRRAEDALSLLQGNDVGTATGDKNATGIKGYLPNSVLQRFDPSGVDTRAAIADLGSLVVHDRSGAAVTAAEFPRLAPFIPQASDSPDAAQKKLENFKRVYQTTNEDAREFYRASGYNVPDLASGQPSATPAPGPGFGAPRAGAATSTAAQQPGLGMPRKVDQAGYSALPSGARFIAPDGSMRVKP